MIRCVTSAAPIYRQRRPVNMRTFRKTVLALLASLCGIASSDSWALEGEQSYGGHPLSYWLRQETPKSRRGFYSITPSPAKLTNEAEDAVRQIGTNAIPILTAMIDRKETTIRKRLRSLLAQQSYVKIQLDSARDWQARAMAGFIVLKQDAVPTLIELLEEPKHRLVALLVLSRIPDSRTVPALLECLNDVNGDVQANSAIQLGRIGEETESVVPALINTLNDINKTPRKFATLALGRFGDRATQAIPALISVCQTDPERSVRNSAAAAILDISEEHELAIEILVTDLVDHTVDNISRRRATIRLGRLRAPSDSVIKALKNTAVSATGVVARGAIQALEQLASRASTAHESAKYKIE